MNGIKESNIIVFNMDNYWFQDSLLKELPFLTGT